MKDSRFVVELNVGRLAKWLRVMGYDTLFPREGGDNQLVRIALREGRILVENRRCLRVFWQGTHWGNMGTT